MSSEISQQQQNQGKTTLTLQSVLQQADYVLCDNSTFGQGKGSDWYWDFIYPIHRFSELDFNSIQRQIEYTKSSLNLLAHPKTFVVSGVSSEILTIVNILSDKISFLLGEEKRSLRRSGKRFTDHSENESVEKVMLNELCNLLHVSYQQSKRSELARRNNEKYNFLERIVLSVTENTGAKVDYEKVYHPNRGPKKVEDFHTSEQLIATALYLSVSESKSCSILTRNSNIRRILFNTLSYLTYPDKSVYRGVIDSATKKNNIRVYYVTGLNELRLDYDSSQFGLSKSRCRILPEKLQIIESQINSGTQ